MNAGEWTLRSRRVVTPVGTRAADVLIRNEAIADLLPHDGPEAEGVILDVGDLWVLPGLVALHREGSGMLDAPWFEAATLDSAAGGITTLINLPPVPGSGMGSTSDSAMGSSNRMDAAKGKIRVDCGLVVPLGRGQVDQIEAWIEAGFIGVEAALGVGFGVIDPGSGSRSGSDSGLGLTSTEADLRAAMPILAQLGRPLFVDSGRLGSSTSAARFGSLLPEREFAAIRLLIRLCRETRCRVHLIHPSASEALPMLAEARAEGLPMSVATCPRHLTLTAEEVVKGLPTFPLDPSKRGPDERNRLWDGLESGLIDAIGPDLIRPSSTPIHPDAGEARLALLEAGVFRLTLPVLWAEAKRRGFVPNHLGRWLAGKPAELVGLASRKGSITPGLDADFAVFDPDTQQVEATILRGTMIYQGGQFFENPKGAVVLRIEETQPIPGTDA